MTVSDKAGKELSKITYTYDLAGNKLTSTEEVDGKKEEARFTYDDNNRLTKLENKDGITTYTYDKNGNRISSKKNDDKLDYIYDNENRLLAVKDKEGLLMGALYDGDDNRVFTASRKKAKTSYQLFKREEKRKSPYTAPNGEEPSLFWYGFSQNVLQALSTLPQTVGTIWHELFDDVSTASKGSKALKGGGEINRFKTFKPGELEIHYKKHGEQLANVLNESNYTMERYLEDANYVIQTGQYSQNKNAYYKFIGYYRQGNSVPKSYYAIVGLDRTTGNITSFHTKNIQDIFEWDSSLGIKP